MGNIEIWKDIQERYLDKGVWEIPVYEYKNTAHLFSWQIGLCCGPTPISLPHISMLCHTYHRAEI